MNALLHTRSAPLETRNEPEDDALAQATAAVEELRSASETFRTEQERAAETRQAEITTLTERLAKLETRSRRPANDNREEGEPVQTRAFNTFMRRGVDRLTVDETRALVVSSEEQGGYLAPEQFIAELQRNLVEISPIRAAARVANASAGTLILPKRTQRLTAQWVGETEDRPGTEPAYGQQRIEMHELACFVDVSNWLLEDAAFNISAELAFDFAEEFGLRESQAFLGGDGVKKPMGIMADPTVPAVAGGHASQLQPDMLIRFMYSLPAFYRNRGAWMMNSSTMAAVRLMKDGAGNYLWREGLADGQPASLLGRPIIDAPDMPDVAANAFPLVFGDFATAYRIFDRVNLSVVRDPFTMAHKGLVRFHARRRVGGAVTQPEAIRKLKIATTASA